MPRADLLSEMQVLLEKGQLKIAKGLREAGALVRELWGCVLPSSSEHDDLALAVALACWQAGRASIAPRMVGVATIVLMVRWR